MSGSEVMILNVIGLFGLIPKAISLFRTLLGSKKTIGICLPARCGKSTIASKFVLNNKTIILDLEEATKLSLSEDQIKRLEEYKAKNQMTSYNSLFYISCKNYVDEQIKAFPNKKFIILSSDRELLKYCGCSVNKIISFSPSNSLFDKIKANIEDEKDRRNVEENRTNILLNNNKKSPINVYESFEQLTNMLGNMLDLKVKL